MFEALILGLVQGLTEFIPISSSGHILLVERLLGKTDLGSGFGGAIHLATAFAAIIYFRKEILNILKSIPSKDKSTADFRMFRNLLFATIPAGIIILVLDKLNLVDQFKDLFSIGITSIIFGFFLLLAEKYNKTVPGDSAITSTKALLIGLSQIIAAVLPGTSRSGITITTGFFLNINREELAKFTFIASIPLTTMAGIYEIFIEKNTVINTELIIALIGAFVSGLIAIYLLLFLIKKYSLTSISIYKILFGVVAIFIHFSI